jgi:sugar/nucleoside kinase (ribokinase family)
MGACNIPSGLILGNLTIDDVVLPDGKTIMGSPGGNAIHVATGVFVNGVKPITIARIGEDFPGDALKKFVSAGLSTDFMIPMSGPTVRNWVIYEWDGSRTWLYRTNKNRSLEVSPEPSDITQESVNGVSVAHIAAMPLSNAERLVARLRELAPQIPIVLDTHEDWIEGYQNRLLSLARKVNYFIPSKEELVVLMNTDDLEFAMREISKYELENVIVKAGGQGAYLLEKQGKIHVPAIKTEVKDTTGAGDAFCGGFTAGIALNLSLYDCVVKGCETAGKAIRNSGSLRLLEN